MKKILIKFIGKKCMYCNSKITDARFKTTLFIEVICENGHIYSVERELT